MKISCISFTANGSRINRRLQDLFESQGHLCSHRALARYAEEAGVEPLEGSFKDWCKEQFAQADVLIVIGATGIAVRGIAPWVQDKKTDPAVLVIDEQGNFVISLLSGHIGGANEMTAEVASYLQAVPVITTGTDVNKTFAVDVFAVKNQLVIESMELAKEIAAAVIDKKIVGFTSEAPVYGPVSHALSDAWEGPVPLGIAVTVHNEEETFKKTLRLFPKVLHLGIGCRRDTPYEMIEKKVSEVMKACRLDWRAVADVSSIDLKKDEAGLIQFSKEHKLPFQVYSAEELQSVKGVFTPSKFVGTITGVDNVCERAAAASALDALKKKKKRMQYQMIQKKMAGDGVTVAIAMEDWSVNFE